MAEYFLLGKKLFWIAKTQQTVKQKDRKNEQKHQKSIDIFNF